MRIKLVVYFFWCQFYSIFCEGTSPIVCTPMTSQSIRVTWHFTTAFPNKTDSIKYFIVSWYSVDEYKLLYPSAENDFRDYVNSDYENEVLRYNYNLDYVDVVDDVATSLGLEFVRREQVTNVSFITISGGIAGNRSYDIGVRAFYKSRSVVTDPTENPYFTCSVTTPISETTTTMLPTVSSTTNDVIVDVWAWFVIVPSLLLIVIIFAISAICIQRYCRVYLKQNRLQQLYPGARKGYNHYVVTPAPQTPYTSDETFSDTLSCGTYFGELPRKIPYLPTVWEDKQLNEDEFDHIIVTKQPSRYVGRSDTPLTSRTSGSRFLSNSRCGRVSPAESESTYLCWSEDEEESYVRKTKRRNNYSRERRRRRVAPSNDDINEESQFLLSQDDYGTKRIGTPAVRNRKLQLPFGSTFSSARPSYTAQYSSADNQSRGLRRTKFTYPTQL